MSFCLVEGWSGLSSCDIGDLSLSFGFWDVVLDTWAGFGRRVGGQLGQGQVARPTFGRKIILEVLQSAMFGFAVALLWVLVGFMSSLHHHFTLLHLFTLAPMLFHL